MIHPSLAAFDTLDVLQLIRSENVGPVTFYQLIRRFGSPKNALDALPTLAARGGMKRRLVIASRQAVEKEYELTQRFGAQMLHYGAANYPALLTEIPDAPPLLMLRGSVEFLGKTTPSLAIVGARNASASGRSFTRKLAKQCGELGFTIVSGLARGIDTAAHQGALASGTVGVIAGGIDNIYPPENAPLYDELAEKGAILSENPFGTSPQSRSFPGRNRIIAGMCEGLLVVEAAPRSGSLITARYGLDYNREVMAVPGSPLDPRCQGTNGLIKQGANLIESAEDVVEALQQAKSAILMPMQEPHAPGYDPAPPDEQTLDDIRQKLEAELSATPIQLDLLARELQLPIATLQPALLELELAGRLARHPGSKVSLLYVEETAGPQAALL